MPPCTTSNMPKVRSGRAGAREHAIGKTDQAAARESVHCAHGDHDRGRGDQHAGQIDPDQYAEQQIGGRAPGPVRHQKRGQQRAQCRTVDVGGAREAGILLAEMQANAQALDQSPA